jgi:hypothetical protein
VDRDADLFDIAEAVDAPRLFFGHGQSRQEHGGQHGDYCDYNEKFD